MRKLNEKEQVLLDGLKGAFGMVSQLNGSITSHKCFECDRLTKRLRGKNWQEFLFRPLDLIGSFSDPKSEIFISRDCFPLLTPEALYFFLPVFLATMLLEPSEADVMFDSTPNLFDPGPVTDDRKLWDWNRMRCEELIGLMSKDQRDAVAATLEFLNLDSARFEPNMEVAIRNLRTGRVVALEKDGGT